MRHSGPHPLTRSAVALVRTAYAVAKEGLEPYSHAKSRHDFVQAQLFAILILREFLDTNYRNTVQALHDFQELRDVLELEKVPHFTTVQKAAHRLIKKGLLNDCYRSLSAAPAPPASLLASSV